MSKKKIFIILIVLAISFVWFFKNNIREKARNLLSEDVKMFVQSFIFGKEAAERLEILKYYNYNEVFLPNTQFQKINLKKQKIPIAENKTKSHFQEINNYAKKYGSYKFFLEIYKNKLIIINSIGQIIQYQEKNVGALDDISPGSYKSNINELNFYSILDTFVYSDTLFLSASKKIKENCFNFVLYKSEIKNGNKMGLNFNEIFESKECVKIPLGGRMQVLKEDNNDFLLVTTGADNEEKLNLAQDMNSIFGKILKFDLINFNYEIYSSGHRNPQGLLVYKDYILSTEHGPKGGDEINLINKGKNYGWPIASYGEAYNRQLKRNKNLEKFDYKNHEENNFEEPIFAFIPSIAISEIIDVNENFSKKFVDNFFITSLGAKSLFRIKFNKKFQKLIFIEKIYIGERIRDIKYSPMNNFYIMALENGSLGILSAVE